MNRVAAARMLVQSRRNPLPLEVERRLALAPAQEDRALVLHNAGYTEQSFKSAVGRRDWLNSDLFKRWETLLANRPGKKRLYRKARRRRIAAGWLGSR